MKESKGRSVTPRPDVQDGQTADGGSAGGGNEEAIRSNPPPSIRGVQRGCPPTAPRRTAEAEHAASVRRTSGAAQRRTLPSPASSRARSLTGRAEGLACRVLFLSHAA